MSRRSIPTFAFAVLGVAGLAPGCGGRESPAPRLRAAAFSDPRTIRLTFSEAMAPPSGIDVAGFRLSLAAKDDESTVYYGLDYAFGTDTEGPVSDSDPSAGATSGASASAGATTFAGSGSEPTGGGDQSAGNEAGGYEAGGNEAGGYEAGGYASPAGLDRLRHRIDPAAVADLEVTSVDAVGSDATQLDLGLRAAVTDTMACAVLAELETETGKAGIFLHHRGSGVESKSGTPLGPIGEHWVLARAKSYVELRGDFPHLDPYLPIPCP